MIDTSKKLLLLSFFIFFSILNLLLSKVFSNSCGLPIPEKIRYFFFKLKTYGNSIEIIVFKISLIFFDEDKKNKDGILP